MASRVGGVVLSLTAASLFAVSIVTGSWWSGHPDINGQTISAKSVHIGVVLAEGCNTGGDGACKSLELGGAFNVTRYAVAGAGVLTTLALLGIVLLTIQRSDRRKVLAWVAFAGAVLGMLTSIALLVQGPDLKTNAKVAVPLGWGLYVFGGATLLAIGSGLAALRPLPPPPRPVIAPPGWSGAPPPGGMPMPMMPAGDMAALHHEHALRASQAHAAQPYAMPPSPGGVLPGPSGPLGVGSPLAPSAPQLRPLYEAAPDPAGMSGFGAPRPAAVPVPPHAPTPVSRAHGIPTPPPLDVPPPLERPRSKSLPPPVDPRSKPVTVPPPVPRTPDPDRARPASATRPPPSPTRPPPSPTRPPPSPTRPPPRPTRPPPFAAPDAGLRATGAAAKLPAPKPTFSAPAPMPVPPKLAFPPVPRQMTEDLTTDRQKHELEDAFDAAATRAVEKADPDFDAAETQLPADLATEAQTALAVGDSTDVNAGMASGFAESTAPEARKLETDQSPIVPGHDERPPTATDIIQPPKIDSLAAALVAPNPMQSAANAAFGMVPAPKPSKLTGGLPQAKLATPPPPSVVAPAPLPAPPPAKPSISTAPESLPPPAANQATTSGPSPACPQCEAPMAWVEAHLRFYCKSCKMYF